MPNKPFPIILFALGALWCLAAANSAHADWSQPIRISEVGGGFYPQIIAQGDTLHVVYENTRYYDKIDYLRSSDGGATWSQHRVLSQYNELTLDPHIIRWNQRLMALWMAYLSNGPYHYNIAFSTSNNDGLTWSAPQYALSSNWEWPFTLAVSGWDSLINVMATWGYADSMYFNNIRSTNFGTGWFTPREIFSSIYEAYPDQSSIINFVHFVWGGKFDTQHRAEIFYTQSNDGGIHWSPNIPLSERTNIIHKCLQSA